MTPDEDIELRSLRLDDADELFALVDRNRSYLRQWLPWVDLNTSREDSAVFIQATLDQESAGLGPQFAIFNSGVLFGVCGFHPIDCRNRAGDLGYWLSEEASGRGIMTRAVRSILGVGFKVLELNRIQIACAVGNVKSRAIPERLGFVFEGVQRQRELLNDCYVDHAVYSMLASEYRFEINENAAAGGSTALFS